jgi:hypothetical protein
MKLEDIVCNVPDWESWFCCAPVTKDHFYFWIKEFFGIGIPWNRDGNCEGHSYPFDAMWEAYAEISPLSIWYANRSGGKTYDLSILAFMESIFKKNCGCNVLGGSLDQAQKAIAYLTEFWASPRAPSHMLINKQVAGRGYRLTNGSWVRALAASSKSVRGSHQPKLRIDEVDELDEKIYLAALGQPKTMNDIPENVIISSTLHQAFGLMSDIIDNRHTTGANLFKWCVREVEEPNGFWKSEEIESKKKQITKEMFDSEYLCLRPKIGDTIFDFDSIDRAYRRGISDKYEERALTEAGLDWGYMVTILNLIQDHRGHFTNPKSFPFEYVELKDRCLEICKICKEYRIDKLYADSNPKDSNITLKKTFEEQGIDTTLVPIAFNKWKSVAINVLRFMLERNLLNITDYTCQKKMKAYHYKNPEIGEIAKEDDHYPDALIAWAASRYKILGI